MSIESSGYDRVDVGQLSGAEAYRLRARDGDLALAADALHSILYPRKMGLVCAKPSSFTEQKFTSRFEYTYLRTTNQRPWPVEIVGARIDHTIYADEAEINQDYLIKLTKQVDAEGFDDAENYCYYLGDMAIGQHPFLGTVEHVSVGTGEIGDERFVNQADCDHLLNALTELQTAVAHTFTLR